MLTTFNEFSFNEEVFNPTEELELNYIYANADIYNFEGSIVRTVRFNTDINADIYNFEGYVRVNNIYQIDFEKDELIVTGSGASDFNRSQVNQELNLGGSPSLNRLESYLYIRENPIESLNIIWISGNNGEGNLNIQMTLDTSNNGYFISYSAPDDSGFGDPVEILYNEEIKLTSEDENKYIFVELLTDTVINRYETIQLRKNYNNPISMSNFDITGNPVQYRAIYFRNQHPDNIEDLKIWSDNSGKIVTRFGVEYPINREISDTTSIYQEPSGISWLSYTDETGASPITNLKVGGFVGVWLENTYDSSTASPYEPVSIHYSYNYDSTSKTGSLHGLSRGYDLSLEGTYKLYYNINDTIDSTSATIIDIDSTSSLPYDILDSTSLSDGDIIYYDLVPVNKYGIESLKRLDQYKTYDSSSDSISYPPIPPATGSLLYDLTGGLLTESTYYPIQETNISQRATKWSVYVSVTDDTGYIVEDEEISMDSTSSNETELLQYIIDTSSLIDETPITVNVYTKRDNIKSLSSLDLTGSINKQVPIRPSPVNVLIGDNFGIHKDNYSVDTTSISLSDTSGMVVDYNFNDGNIELKLNDEYIWKAFYKDTGNIYNKFYLESSWTLDNSGSFDTSSNISDNNNYFEIDGTDFYFLVNTERLIKFDTTGKTITIINNFTSEASLEEVYTNEYIFPRYYSTVFSIWNVRDQIKIPYLILDSSGNLKTNLIFDNTYTNDDLTYIL